MRFDLSRLLIRNVRGIVVDRRFIRTHAFNEPMTVYEINNGRKNPLHVFVSGYKASPVVGTRVEVSLPRFSLYLEDILTEKRKNLVTNYFRAQEIKSVC